MIDCFSPPSRPAAPELHPPSLCLIFIMTREPLADTSHVTLILHRKLPFPPTYPTYNPS